MPSGTSGSGKIQEMGGNTEVLAAANDPASRPVRVLPLVVDVPLGEHVQMTLISIEAWSTFFALRWYFTTLQPSDEVDRRLQARGGWDAADDAGNSYSGGDYGGGGGSSLSWTMTTWFAPALASDAQVLTLSLRSPLDGQEVQMQLNLPR